MVDQEKTILDAIRQARLKADAERAAAGDILLPVMTTRSGEELARESAGAVGLAVDVRPSYAQKGGGPVPLIIDLESFIRQHGPASWQLLENALASWAVKKAADSVWYRIVAWVREVQNRSPDGASLQVLAVDKEGHSRNYKVPSKERLETAITQLPLDLDTPGVPGERLWVDGQWMPSGEYFRRPGNPE